MGGGFRVRAVNGPFLRHDRYYVLFAVEGRDDEFLYYSHTNRPLKSLMFGRDFSGQIPQLLKKEELCIECGLGLSIKGGVALDDGEIIAWNMTAKEANAILSALRQNTGSAGHWISLF